MPYELSPDKNTVRSPLWLSTGLFMMSCKMHAMQPELETLHAPKLFLNFVHFPQATKFTASFVVFHHHSMFQTICRLLSLCANKSIPALALMFFSC